MPKTGKKKRKRKKLRRLDKLNILKVDSQVQVEELSNASG